MNTMNNRWLPIRFIWIIASAFLLSFIFILNAYINHSYTPNQEAFDWYFEIMLVVTNYLLWAFLFPLLYRFIVTNKFAWQLSFRTILMHILLGLLIAVFHRYASLAFYIGMTWSLKGYLLDLFGIHSANMVIRGVISSMLQYWIIIGVLWGFEYYRQKRQQELLLIKTNQELADAQLNALKMQLHPHFFFNTLNTISSVMDRSVEEAQDIVAKLARLMRALLDSEKQQVITLRQEIDYIRAYLDLEQARFSDRLLVKIEVDDAVLNAGIPNLLLQPLVENSIKHGLSSQAKQGAIEIYAEMIQKDLVIKIKDNGKGVANADYVFQNPGIGIKSVLTRLKVIYQSTATIHIESSYQAGFCVIIKIPYKPLSL